MDQLFWGDIHNHCAVGYAKGSLERAYDIARSHLHVFAFTGHAQWHDTPTMPGERHMKWVNGTALHAEQWPRVQRLAREHYEPGAFVTLLAYEWHSSEFGDYCVYYPDDDRELRFFDHVRELQAYAREAGCLILPHHPAYKQGWRGANLEWLETDVSPTMEVFSEHGNAENDRATFPYWRHSNGPRWTANTFEAAWQRGLRLGVTAGTDDHLGYPGAYLEGLTGFWAPELTREGIWSALRSRRTYGVTGDRIALDFRVNDAPMGGTTAAAGQRRIMVSVYAPDEVDRIEVVRGVPGRGEQVIHREFPVDRPGDWAGQGHVRVEFGWGPWGALDLERIADWSVAARVEGGRILRALPCFQSGPFDEARRNRIDAQDEHEVRWTGYTSRREAIGEMATNAMILEIEAAPEAELVIDVAQPTETTVRRSVGELAQANAIEFMGGFTSESLVVHRPVPLARSETWFEIVDAEPLDAPAYYRVRVTQTNGHLAWSSPVWVGDA